MSRVHPVMMDARVLWPDEWALLSNLRLDALKDSPGSFLSTFEVEKGYEEPEWRAEFSRGEWTVADQQGTLVGLLGTTWEANTPPDECFLEYMWVSPGARRCGVASILINEAVHRLRQNGVSTVRLWVLDGNEPARCFYRKHGFALAGIRQAVTHQIKHYEEMLVCHI